MTDNTRGGRTTSPNIRVCTRCKKEKPDYVRVSRSVAWVPDYPPTDPLPLSSLVCTDCLTDDERERYIERKLIDNGVIRDRPPWHAPSPSFERIETTDGSSMSEQIVKDRDRDGDKPTLLISDEIDDGSNERQGEYSTISGPLMSLKIKGLRVPTENQGAASNPDMTHSLDGSVAVQITRLKAPKPRLHKRIWHTVIYWIYVVTDRIAKWSFQALQPNPNTKEKKPVCER